MSPTLTGQPSTVHTSADLGASARAVARRLAAGRTLWAVSPSGPVLSAPSVARLQSSGCTAVQELPWHDVTAALRARTQPDDVVLLVGPAADPTLTDLARRGPAWGVLTVWAASGDRPAAGAADHVLAGPDAQAAVALLVEATCDLLRAGSDAFAPPPACDGPVCTTCSDEGRLAEVVRACGPTAEVRTAQGCEEVDLTLVGPALPHDLLVVHAGTAITLLERQTR